MTQAEMERELARTTGESLTTIRGLGFSFVEIPDRDPLVVDWDHVQQREPLRYVPRRRPRRVQQAA